MIQAAVSKQSLFASNQAQPSCTFVNVGSMPKCYGTSGLPSAPGMFGGQRHGASLCKGCRYKKRYQEWACIACGATGMLCYHQRQQDTSHLSCNQAVIELPPSMLLLDGEAFILCYRALMTRCVLVRHKYSMLCQPAPDDTDFICSSCAHSAGSYEARDH